MPPQVADGGDGLRMWRVAANVSQKQQRTADRGWLFSLGVGRGLTTPHRRSSNLLRNVAESLRPGRIIWYDVSTGIICRTCSLRTAARELGKCKLDLVGVQEAR
jgi:hypothetical protein